MISIHVWNPELVGSNWNQKNPPPELTGDSKTDSEAIAKWESETNTSVSSYIQVVDKDQLNQFLNAVLNEGNLTLSTYPTPEDL